MFNIYYFHLVFISHYFSHANLTIYCLFVYIYFYFYFYFCLSAAESIIGGKENNNDEDREYEKKGKISSQFCWNGMVVSKEHLVRTMRTAFCTYDENSKVRTQVPFLPITYDLSSTDELRDFISDYTERENKIKRMEKKRVERKNKIEIESNISSSLNELEIRNITEKGISGNSNNDNNDNDNDEDKEDEICDNIWIMKRYRGRQSMDYPITSNLSCALRHLESSPRLACKYISNPSLFKTRKYDLRFYVIIQSLDPLIIFRHKMFVVRAANHPYSSSDLEQYQKHFTVMNFVDDTSNSAEDSVRIIRGCGGRENPTSVQFIKIFNLEHAATTTTYTTITITVTISITPSARTATATASPTTTTASSLSSML